ncbi:MAG TPA: hypothetical protein VKB35_16360 [Ktedonobacteraceae bacterium]|nr:hypothetical protein [Ktedonobacteraceae bacterium]
MPIVSYAKTIPFLYQREGGAHLEHEFTRSLGYEQVAQAAYGKMLFR